MSDVVVEVKNEQGVLAMTEIFGEDTPPPGLYNYLQSEAIEGNVPTEFEFEVPPYGSVKVKFASEAEAKMFFDVE